MARRGLAGGYREIAIGVGGAHLASVDVAAAARGWSRAEWFRRASEALLRAGEASAELGIEDDDELVVDIADAVEDLADPLPSAAPYTGAVIARGASEMQGGRWAGWYPADVDDVEIVADLRQHVPDGTVYLRRPRNVDAHVHAYVDPPEEVARLARFGLPASPFYRVIGPD